MRERGAITQLSVSYLFVPLPPYGIFFILGRSETHTTSYRGVGMLRLVGVAASIPAFRQAGLARPTLQWLLCPVTN